MKFGAGFSLMAMSDAHAVRDFAQTLDEAGFNFTTIGGHLLSAEPGRFEGRPLPTYVGPFHEPFALFSYLAGLTKQLEFRTSILILPLFQTAVVAKEAAELSILSGGRFQLGVGISWNPAEYEALGQDFRTRARRMEEQIAVLRLLWAEPIVTFKGRWHNFDRVGLNRLPPAAIPVLIGCGTDDKPLRRVAKIADGWLPIGDPTEPMQRLRRYLEEEGRDPEHFILGGRLVATSEGADAWIKTARALKEVGVTDLTITAPPELDASQVMERIVEAKNVLAGALS
jgi:probable F420-dependent oxidoreductase